MTIAYEKIVVAHAGLGPVNGVYHCDGTFDSVGKYIKHANWKGAPELFSLYRCNVSNNSKQWFISIVPSGVQPGTKADLDFYSAPMDYTRPDLPPSQGWTTKGEGLIPLPTIRIITNLIEDGPRKPNEKVIVANAGLGLVNGVYRRDGSLEGVRKFTRHGEWKGSSEVFSLYLCEVSNKTKHWYISIAPAGRQPGTNADIDFYSAPMGHERPDFPPTHGWTKAQDGAFPPPTITTVMSRKVTG